MNEMNFRVNAPPVAALLRRLLAPFQSVRGVPRLLYWLRWVAFGNPRRPILVTTPDALPVMLLPDDYGQLMLFYFPYCRELQTLLADSILPGNGCFDLGANVGLLTMQMALLTGVSGRVVAVDPNPALTGMIEQTVRASGLTQVDVIQAGISGTSGTGYFAIPAHSNSESGEVLHQTNAGLPVPLYTLAGLMQAAGLTAAPDFIKFDVEGMEGELPAILGRLLERGCRPLLLVEFHPHKCHARQTDPEQVRQFLYRAGYEERHVEPYQAGYRLANDPAKLLTNANLMYAQPAHLADRPRLRQAWAAV